MGSSRAYLPVSAVADRRGRSPDVEPVIRSTFAATNFQGVANNEGTQALQANMASQTFGVTGAGVTVGVLSDSVNQAANPEPSLRGWPARSRPATFPAERSWRFWRQRVAGCPAQYAGHRYRRRPGDAREHPRHRPRRRPGVRHRRARRPVVPAEHHGAAVAGRGQRDRRRPRQYPTTRCSRTGLSPRAINTVVANGATYLSAAGNSANDGYLSQFRPVHGHHRRRRAVREPT